MKKLLIGLLILGNFSAFASAECTAFIYENSDIKSDLREVLEKNGFSIVTDEEDAEIKVKTTLNKSYNLYEKMLSGSIRVDFLSEKHGDASAWYSYPKMSLQRFTRFDPAIKWFDSILANENFDHCR